MKTPQERSDEEAEIEPLGTRPPAAQINTVHYLIAVQKRLSRHFG
ncbi:hypothetical protein [Sporosarcina aquimarina]|nr:hypothetical protein [Sporosarcina aquimarina]